MNKKFWGIITICLIVVLLLSSKTIFKKEEKQQGEQSGFVQEIVSSEFENEVLNSSVSIASILSKSYSPFLFRGVCDLSTK